jgi:hypothetical protein
MERPEALKISDQSARGIPSHSIGTIAEGTIAEGTIGVKRQLNSIPGRENAARSCKVILKPAFQASFSP